MSETIRMVEKMGNGKILL